MPNASAVDLVWGEHGAAARIAASLAHISRLALRGRDVDVTHGRRAPPVPAVQPIAGVTISNCDFGTLVASGTPTVTSTGPIHAFNVSAMTLTNVTIAGQAVNTTITD